MCTPQLPRRSHPASRSTTSTSRPASRLGAKPVLPTSYLLSKLYLEEVGEDGEHDLVDVPARCKQTRKTCTHVQPGLAVPSNINKALPSPPPITIVMVMILVVFVLAAPNQLYVGNCNSLGSLLSGRAMK